jgi:hypothetical protein
MQAAIQTDIEAGRGPADASQYGRPYAGGNQDTDNEGAIDTGDQSVQEDNSGAAPVIGGAIPGEDNSGAAPVMPASPQGGASGQQHFTPNLNPADVPGNMKRIVSYLLGADAAPLQAIDQVGQQVDPQGQMAPGDRNLVGIDQAGDVAKQWQLLQAHRKAFMAKQSFAYAALTGSAQKPADINAAIDAANQAEQHIPDGSNVRFSRSQNGVTATVTMPGTAQPQQIQLTPEQFKQYLDVGNDGQWDKLQQASVPATLQRLSQSTMSKVTGVPDKGPPAGSVVLPEPQPKTNFGKTPSTLNLSGSDEQQPPPEDKTGYGDELEQRAMKVFPGITQNAQRQQWMAAQEEKELERQNKLDVEEKRGTFKVQAADTTGTHREGAADITGKHRENAAATFSKARIEAAKSALQSHIQQQEAIGTRNQRTLQEKALGTILATGGTLNPMQQKMWDQIISATPEPQQAPAPQQRAPAQAAPAKQLSDHDQQAAAWAKANPNDPRAAQIMQKLGAQ